MKSLIPSPMFRYSTILVLIIVCTVALIKSATTSAQEGSSNAERAKAQEASQAGNNTPERKTDVLERLVSSDPATKSPSDSRTILQSQLDAGANLLVPSITATKVDTIFTDVDGDGRADPGDTLLYTVTISNAGTDATAVVFSDTIDANTTLVGGSTNTTPIAFDDPGYTAAGNVRITISAASGVLVNDIDPDTGNNTGLTASAGATSAQGGNVAMSANGGFSYNPAPGFTGTDTFTYTVTDAGGATGTGTVTFNVSGMIWFVNAAAGGGGDGRLTNPFNCYTGVGCFSAVAVDDPGDNIFLYSGAYTGGNTLLANQRLIGQGAGATLSTITGITPPTGSDALPATGGARPTVTTVVAATNAVNLGSGNTLRGFNIGNTTAADIAGTGFGTLTASEMDLNGTGAPLILTTGTLAATFDSLTATSAAGGPGVGLTGVGGTLTVSGTTSIAGAGTQGISISGSSVVANFGTSTTIGSTTQGILIGTSTGNISFGNTSVTAGADGVSFQNNSAGTRSFGTLSTTNGTGVGFLHGAGGGLVTVSGQATFTNPGGRCVDIQNSTTTITFANVNATQCGGTGVFLSANTGAVTFDDLDITPDSGQRGFQSTNQATGAITTTSGTITTTNATAVEITGTSAASKTPLNIQFTTVATTGGGVAPNGIFLRFTSATGAPGGFRVLGTGGTCTSGTPTCSGGTITNTSGADNTNNGIGVYMEDVATIVLTRMHINIHPNHAIRGKLVAGLTLDTCVVDGDNGTSASADDDGFDNGEDAIRISDLTGSAAITNSFVAGGFEDTIRITNATGTLNRLTVSGSTIGGRTNNGTSMDDAFSFTSRNSVTMNLTVSGCTFTTGRGDIFNPRVLGSSNMDLVFRGNNVSNNHPSVVTGGGGTTIASTSTGTFTYDISCNKFLGGANLKTHNLLLFKGAGSGGTLSGTIFNNKIGVTGVVNSGSPDGSSGLLVDSQGSGTNTVLIKNNVVRNYGEVGIRVLASSGSVVVNATIIGNQTFEPDASAGFAGLQVQSGALAADSTTINARVGSSSVAAEKNDFTAGDPFNFNDVEISQAGGVGGVKVVNLSRAGSASGTVAGVITDDNLAPVNTFNFGVVNLVAGNPATPVAIDETCTPPARQASDDFAQNSSGIETQTDIFSNTDQVFVKLMARIIEGSQAVGTQSTDAAGDVNASSLAINKVDGSVSISQWQSSLFASLNNRSDNHSDTAPSLSGTAPSEAVSLNHARAQEERRNASDGNAEVKDHDAQETKPQDDSVKTPTDGSVKEPGKDVAPESGETITVNGGSPAGFTLPAGKSITITFRVTINSPLPSMTQVSNQGSVSGSNFLAVILTDDPSVGGSADPTVTPIDHTTVAVSSNGNPSVFSQNVTFTATMTGVPSRVSDPPGTVQFKADGNNIGAAVPIVAGAVNDNVSTAQASISSLTVATHVITAEYSGGGAGATKYNANIGTLAGGQMVGKANTTTAVTSSQNPSVFGQSVTFTATVAPVAPGAGSVSGTVNFLDGGNPIASCQNVALSSSQAQCIQTGLVVGNHTISASYGGDSNFNTSSGNMTGNPQVVNKANTSVGLTSATNPSVFGQSVTFTATLGVTAPGSGTPTGTVQFLDGVNPIAGCTSVALAAGQAQCLTSALVVGNHTITAAYSGDGNFNTSNGSMTGNPQVVNKASTSVGLTSATNPSVFGQSVTFTATMAVTAPGAGTPTGTIQFLDGVNPIAGCTSVALAAGQAQCLTSALAVGNHTITAAYSGDGNFNTSNGSMTGNPQVVNKADTSVGLTSATNPSVFGQSVTFTATMAVTAPGAGTPTGTINFLDGVNPVAGCQNVAIAAGQAQCLTSALAVGNHTITAAYSGDGNFNTSTGSMTGNPQVVNKANTTVGLTSATNPSVFGQSVTFTATIAVTAPGAGTPTGTINFLDGVNPIAGCQNIAIAAGQAQCLTSALAVGNHTITAAYSGDGNFNTSTGSMTGNPQVVNKANTSVGLTSSQNPAPLGTNLTFTATLSVTAPGAGTPSGTVQFLDGVNPIAGCTAVAVAAGQAQCMTNALTVGNHTITAAYSGDASFNTSNGSLTGNPQVITGAPVITPTVGLNRVQGSPATNSQVAVVSDDVASPGAITVTAETVPAGMTFTNIVNTNGTITANVGAQCGAATGNNVIVLKATDGKALSQTANLTVNVTPNPAPTLGNYPNATIVVGCKLFATPDAPPADNVSVSSVMASGSGGFSGIISVDPATGLVTITNNGPVGGPFTITVTVTDNCGATVQKMFTVTVVNPPTAPTEFDFDGDRKADISVYRTGATANDPSYWYILRSSDNVFQPIQFGADSDVIVPGDYNGDGTTDVGIYRPGTNTWFTSLNPATNYGAFQWGTAGDIPVPGFYDADNKTDIAVFRPSDGNWYIAKSTGGSETRHWGQSGDKPIAADVDGDGKTDLVQYRPSQFTFYIQKSGGGTVVQAWGQAGDKIVFADYDGDNKDDIAVFRPSNAFWYILQSTGGTRTEQWGLAGAGDVPAPADYDNDGKADLMIYRTTEGAWYIFKSCLCTPLTTPFGVTTDKPIPTAFTP